MTELETRLSLRDAEGKLIVCDQRTLNILRHYESEIAKGHMTLNIAADRAKSDLAGNNGHKDKPQRG